MLTALMNREVLDRWCELGILALVLAILIFGPLAFGAVPPAAFLVIQGLTLGVLMLWGVRLWLQARPQLLWTPICWAVVAFVVYAIIRYLAADIEYVARQELIRVLVYAILFLAVLNNLSRQEATQAISFVLIFLAMVLSCHAVYQFLTGSNRIWNVVNTAYPHRASGTYICPNHLGGFLEMVLPLGLAYTLASRVKPVLRVFLGYASLTIMAGIVVTLSRGSWLSTALSLVVFFGVLLFQRGHRLASLALLVVILGGAGYFLSGNYSLLARIKRADMKDAKAGTRVMLWESALKIWQEDIWWGVGPAHYDYRFRQYRPELVQQRPAWAHNDVLNALVDWGVAGTCLVAAAWGLLGLGVVKTWGSVRGSANDLRGRKNSNKFAFVLGASVGLFAILVHSTCDFNMHIPANAVLAVTLMALLSSHLRFATERYWARVGILLRLAATAVLLAGTVYLGQQGWRLTKEYRNLRQAAAAPNFSPENYRALATQAMDWFGRTMKLNRWDGYGCLRYGWCLDWLDRAAESEPYFNRAEELDPNGYFTLANIGLHYVQVGDYAAAKPWFERSLRLEWLGNVISRTYLEIANARLLEAASNGGTGRLEAPAP